ncbi:DUF928 domain-containing protein [Leptolyngbya sp. DQ-M1]|uniref:DUF928 domain-containing protein n=1 Tax=Leptolyngbya sp. DQ-M1 TaxID=2933920 RepID=UPI003297BB35
MTSDSPKFRLVHPIFLGIGTLSLVALQGVLPLDLPLPSPVSSLQLSPANAQYNPPKRPGFGSSEGTGTRGDKLRLCGERKTASFTTLAPTNHIGETISSRPTLFWYLSSRQTVELKLMQPGVQKPVFVTTVQVDKPGIVSLELPKTAPELVPEKVYRWSIAVVCEDGTKDALRMALIRRVALIPEVKQRLAIAQSDQERGQVYAAQDLWYDAVTMFSKAATANPKDRTAPDKLLSLLDQVGFEKVTEQERKKNQPIKR